MEISLFNVEDICGTASARAPWPLRSRAIVIGRSVSMFLQIGTPVPNYGIATSACQAARGDRDGVRVSRKRSHQAQSVTNVQKQAFVAGQLARDVAVPAHVGPRLREITRRCLQKVGSLGMNEA